MRVQLRKCMTLDEVIKSLKLVLVRDHVRLDPYMRTGDVRQYDLQELKLLKSVLGYDASTCGGTLADTKLEIMGELIKRYPQGNYHDVMEVLRENPARVVRVRKDYYLSENPMEPCMFIEPVNPEPSNSTSRVRVYMAHKRSRNKYHFWNFEYVIAECSTVMRALTEVNLDSPDIPFAPLWLEYARSLEQLKQSQSELTQSNQRLITANDELHLQDIRCRALEAQISCMRKDMVSVSDELYVSESGRINAESQTRQLTELLHRRHRRDRHPDDVLDLTKLTRSYHDRRW